ncbi:MAG: NADPH-dependent FMN reductase [Actinomycetota bacterium]
MPRLLIVVASTRPGRVGRSVADWFIEVASRGAPFDVDVVDLAVLDLPFLDEPNHPSEQRYIHPHTKRWSDMVAAADAVVLVMPEYNHGFSAPLKNALDFLYREWEYKPVGFVSYGGISGGTRAVQMIKQVVTTFRMFPVAEAVNIPYVKTHMTEDASFRAPEGLEGAALKMLDVMARLTEALAPMRVSDARDVGMAQ